MRYEIAIEPQDGIHCGRCGYRKSALGDDGAEWRCTLFDRGLTILSVPPVRCEGCKHLTGRLAEAQEEKA